MKRMEWKWDADLPPGPWQDEPSKVQWADPTTGMACMIRRGPMGVWCGYVGVDETHPWFGQKYDEVDGVEVHGGLTYSAACDGDEEHGICHVPEPGEPEPLWWFGFDCGHYQDLSPRMLASDAGYTMEGQVYRDQAYATTETTNLAQQIAMAHG